jgi:hypothetical protein
MVPDPLPGGVISVGIGGARTRATGFLLWMFFELRALALVAGISSRATCLAAIVSKPPRSMPKPTFVNKRFEVRKERKVLWEFTWIRWVGSEASADLATPCAGAAGGASSDGDR